MLNRRSGLTRTPKSIPREITEITENQTLVPCTGREETILACSLQLLCSLLPLLPPVHQFRNLSSIGLVRVLHDGGAVSFQARRTSREPVPRANLEAAFDFNLLYCIASARLPVMSAIEATAEVFVTAFKTLKPRQREAVLTRMLTDEELSEDIADTLALEARRHQPRQAFRQALKELKISV